PRRQDKEMNLLGPDAQKEFRDQHLIAFLRFWRVMVPISLGLLAAVFLAGDLFLMKIKQDLEKDPIHTPGDQNLAAIQELQEQVRLFNASVASIASLRNELAPKHAVLEKINALASQNNVTVTRFSFRGFGKGSSFAGEASSEDRVRAFKNTLEKDGSFQAVDLPLDAIRPTPSGVSFTGDFTVNPVRSSP
ncbi:MAG: hypothetical protein AAB967_01615, partial [Patescibacteria group bacterium]